MKGKITFNENDKIGYITTERFNNKPVKVFYTGYWDGEKGILNNGKLIVRKKEWLFEITTQLGR